MPRYLVFTILLSVVSLKLAGTLGAAVAESDRRIVVLFVQPQHFTDITYSRDFHTSGTLLNELHQFIREIGAFYVPAGMQLEIKVTDVDLAGDFTPWRSPQFDHVRILRGIYPPRIALEFRLTDGSGDIVSAGKCVLYDIDYQQRVVRSPDDYLRYEKELLRDWFRSEFSDLKSADPAAWKP